MGGFGRFLPIEIAQDAAVRRASERHRLDLAQITHVLRLGVAGAHVAHEDGPRLFLGEIGGARGFGAGNLLGGAGGDGVGRAAEVEALSDELPGSPGGSRGVCAECQLGQVGQGRRAARQHLPGGGDLALLRAQRLGERLDRAGMQQRHVLRAHLLRLAALDLDVELLAQPRHTRGAQLVEHQTAFKDHGHPAANWP